MGLFKHYVVPSLLVVGMPVFVQFLANYPRDEGLAGFRLQMLFGNALSWFVTTSWLLWCAAFLHIPFDRYKGLPAPDGHSPIYSDNCLAMYTTTLFSYMGLHTLWMDLSTIMYNNLPYILGTANIYGIGLSLYFWKRGQASRQRDSSAIYEFFSGTELHPRIIDIDVKQWLTTRVATMAWENLIFTLILASYFKTGFQAGTLVNVCLQLYYLHRFFEWEPAFLTTLDITSSRVGFYLVWGCVVLVPSLCTYSTHYLVNHPPKITYLESLVILLVGLAVITIRYMIDKEKDNFRLANGDLTVWGKKAAFVEADYQTVDGPKTARLLTSGFWGISRHLNYVFEFLSVLSWSIVGYRLNSIQPFLHLILVTILLLHRIQRNERKCAEKYGSHWDRYCKIVPYKLIPYVY